MRTIALALAASTVALARVSAAPERHYYTREVIQTARDNIARYEWARKEQERIVGEADKWVKYDDSTLRLLVTPPEVPRAIVAHEQGAPVNGEELNRLGRYSWIISFDRPYKVQSPVDGSIYPSNDFLAYYRSGLDERGIFDEKRADRSLLTGPYPDDGWGCKVPGFEKPFWFVGVYAHWSVIRLLLPAIENLSKAYLLTDDPRYAHACAVLLWQLADYYPRYAYERQSRYGKEVQPDYVGRLLYHTWESLYTCHVVPPAYDAIRTAIEGDRALMEMTGQTAGEIRRHIEERLLRTMARDITDGSGRIHGNYGMHQVSLLRIATVLSGCEGTPSSEEMVAWVLRNPDARSYTQIGLLDALNNLIHRDGYPFESPSYNCAWMREIGEIVASLGDAGEPIRRSPRFRKLYTWPMRMTVAGEFVPSYGDSNHLFHGLLGWSPEYLETAFRLLGDPVMAKAIVSSGSSPTRDLFQRPLDEEIERAATAHPAPLGLTSDCLPAVGFASLQTGSDANRTGLALFYGYYSGHLHYDRLQLDVYSWRNALTPDFGYPETADSYDPRRFGFLSHTVAHNTVMLDARRQEAMAGRLHLFDPGEFAQIVEASAEDCYAGLAKLYRRTLILVEVSDDKAFAVDIFRVRGGTQHDWLIHGTQAEFLSDLPLTAPRTEGTLAGADVPYGYFYDDRRYDDNNRAHVPYYEYRGSGYQWLFNVQSAPLEGVGTATWRLNRPKELFPPQPREGVALRAHLIGRAETVFACDGIPQRRKDWPERIKFLVRRRTGQDLESVFVTVLEPYRNQPFIESVKALPIEGSDMPVALEVACDGARYAIFDRLDAAEGQRSVLRLPGDILLDARAAVLRMRNDDVTRGYVLDDVGSRIPYAPALAAATGASVLSVDYATGEVVLDSPIVSEIPPAGGLAIVEGHGHASAVPVARRIAADRFSVGDDDLTAAMVHVSAVEGDRVIFKPPFAEFAAPGMTAVNARGEAVGRVRSLSRGVAILDRATALDRFPEHEGSRICRFVVVGPGDRVTFHAGVRWHTKRP